NRDKAVALGLEPYGRRVDGLTSLDEAKRLYDAAGDEAHKSAGKALTGGYTDQRPVVTVAGRIVLHRENGELIWLNLRDFGGDLQVAVSQRDCDETGFNFAKTAADLGDVVVATGPLVKTKTGEITVWATALEPASKCLVPPPEKHAGLHDVELRYRRRY